MAHYLVDFCLNLYHSERIEARSPEEAQARASLLLDSDAFWAHLLSCYNDPLQTDWLPENVEVTCYGEADET